MSARIERRFPRALRLLPVLLLAACGSADKNIPGDASDHDPFAQIGEDETLRFTGTEPFWGGSITGATLTYTTPEDQEGESTTVSRFAGRGGLSFSGALGGRDLLLAFTRGECSDGMSDRTYPFVVTLRLGAEERIGCGWSDMSPPRDPATPVPEA